MAAGDFKWFAQGLHDLGNKIHDLDSDNFRIGIVSNSSVPAVNTAGPHWGGTGTTNFAANQVATGTGYSGPIALDTETWTLTATGAAFDFNNISIPKDEADGFSNGAYGIVYNDSDANKRAIGYLEISSGGSASNVGGALNLNINASGALALVQS